MGSGKKDINPVVLKIGLVLAFSLGGIIFDFIRNKRIKPAQSPPDSTTPSDCNNQGISRRGGSKSENLASHKATNSCKFDPLATDKQEELHNFMLDLSPSNKLDADKDYYLLPEFNDLVKEFDTTSMKMNPNIPISNSEPPPPKGDSRVIKESHEQEIKNLKNTVKILKEREQNLETQLLELHGLKEQESVIIELQKRLKLNNMETKLLALKVESLQTDNKRLQSQVMDYNKVIVDLEDARAKIKALKTKLRLETVQNKERILDLQHRVEKMQEDECKGGVGIDLEKKLNLCKMKDLESEVEDLRKSNDSLVVEKIELTRKLEHAQKLATSLLEDEKTEKLKEEREHLNKQNEDLTKEIEKLQSERCSDIEELVYLRWINACLRYELRNHQPGSGKTTARDLSKTLSPNSEQKAKKLILEYANKEGGPGINIPELDSDQWSSSQSSNFTDSVELDESCIDYSSSRKSNYKVFGKLVKLLKGKDNHDHDVHRQFRNSSLDRTCSDNLGFSCKHYMELKKSMHRRSDDLGMHKRIDSIAEGGLDSPCSSDGQKSEIVKYAEALKDSNPDPKRMGKYRRRSVSFSSF